MPTPSHGQPLSIADSLRFLPFLVCCSTLVWYRAISWSLVYFNLVIQFWGSWLFQCFSHHSTSSWCVPSSRRPFPEAILESARIDGASEARIFLQICLPLHYQVSQPSRSWQLLVSGMTGSTPFLHQEWQLVSIAIFAHANPTKYGLHRQSSRAIWSTGSCSTKRKQVVWPWLWSQPFQSAILYPFFQRYFVKGLTIGGEERIVLVEKNHFISQLLRLALREVRFWLYLLSSTLRKVWAWASLLFKFQLSIRSLLLLNLKKKGVLSWKLEKYAFASASVVALAVGLAACEETFKGNNKSCRYYFRWKTVIKCTKSVKNQITWMNC